MVTFLGAKGMKFRARGFQVPNIYIYIYIDTDRVLEPPGPCIVLTCLGPKARSSDSGRFYGLGPGKGV